MQRGRYMQGRYIQCPLFCPYVYCVCNCYPFQVNDISSLEQIKGQLKSLNLHGLTLAVSEEGMASTIQLLTEMSRLQHLDISDERDAQHPLDMIAIIPNRKISATEFLVQAKDKLPQLKSLDLSAKDDLQLCQRSGSGETSYPPEELTEFIEYHPLLRFLGLAFTKACKADVFSRYSSAPIQQKISIQ